MSAVFLDTVGLLALWDEADQWHGAAAAAYSQLVQSRRSFVTSTFVLLECGNAAARRPYRDQVSRLRTLLEKRQELITPTKDDWDAAWVAYDLGKGGQAGIVDQVSFAIMRRLQIAEVFTNDQHFRQAGMKTLF